MRRLSTARRALAIALVCGVTFTVGAAFASYLGSGWFPWTTLYWAHLGTTSDSGGSYTSPAADGMWSWDVNTDVNFIQSSYWDIALNHQNYGNTGWTGYAYICSTNSGCDSPSAWNDTYSWCSARINTYLLWNDSYSQRRNTQMHEVGHCLSLAHRWEGSSLMYPSQQTVITPNGNDRSLVNARY